MPGASDSQRFLPLNTSPYLLRQGLSLKPGLPDWSSWLTNELQKSACIHLPSSSAPSTEVSESASFYMNAVTQIWVLLVLDHNPFLRAPRKTELPWTFFFLRQKLSSPQLTEEASWLWKHQCQLNLDLGVEETENSPKLVTTQLKRYTRDLRRWFTETPSGDSHYNHFTVIQLRLFFSLNAKQHAFYHSQRTF